MCPALNRTLLAAVACCTSIFCEAVETPVSIGELFAKLETAERELSFRGHFTHEHGGTIDSFEILRLVVDGIEYEKTSKLTGPEGEKVRIGRDIRCLTKSNHLLRGHHLNLKLGGAVSLEQSYNFYFLGEDRVAGRDALVVRVEPKDRYRYGYWLSIDKASGLIIRSVITSGKKKALERAQFVFVKEFGANTDPAGLIPAEHLQRIEKRAARRENGRVRCDIDVKYSAPWRPSWVPPGFLLTSYSYSDDEGHMETYSDGLGVFSVFINDFREPQTQRVLAHRGATVALMTRVELPERELNVTVVGELPLLAAQKISSSIATVQTGE